MRGPDSWGDWGAYGLAEDSGLVEVFDFGLREVEDFAEDPVGVLAEEGCGLVGGRAF